MNCLIVDDEPVAQGILKDFISKVDFLKMAGCSSTANEVYQKIQKQSIDLIFPPINIPGIDGSELIISRFYEVDVLNRLHQFE